jgi:hypothetical protein
VLADVLLGRAAPVPVPLNNPAGAAIAAARRNVISHALPPYACWPVQAARTRPTPCDAADALDGALPELPRAARRASIHQVGLLTIDTLGTIVDGLRVRQCGSPALPRLVEALDSPASNGLSAELPGGLGDDGSAARVLADELRVRPRGSGAHQAARRAPLLEGLTTTSTRPRHRRPRRCGNSTSCRAEWRLIRPAFGADPGGSGGAEVTSRHRSWRLPQTTHWSAVARWPACCSASPRREAAAAHRRAGVGYGHDQERGEIGVALALVGAVGRDGQGKIFRFALRPLQLGRPRIDVLLDVSPVFRDTFR